jgi:hypothetical protein
MVQGEIKIQIVSGVPNLYVCDGVKTARLPLDQYETSGILGSPSNGQLLITTWLGTGADCEIAVGYGGYWFHTNRLWVDDTGFSGGVPGETVVIPYTRTGGMNLPALLIRDNANGHWWCNAGWIAA